MVDHNDDPQKEANFYPVDGIRGNCKCGEYLHYKAYEGEYECECGRVYNIYVDHELLEEK